VGSRTHVLAGGPDTTQEGAVLRDKVIGHEVVKQLDPYISQILAEHV